jgi:hypothetical protein
LQEWLGREDEVIGFSRANGMEIRIWYLIIHVMCLKGHSFA